ncbi:MAG TPA: ABC-ATPase domain-containing protein [Bacillales bacterium]|nr:ABC-ATPase domain-containing protein [Bacillales bacterium]
MNELRKHLSRIDGKGYKAYKDIQGAYSFPDFRLAIDYVQGDPFASPSKIRCLIPREKTIIKREWFDGPKRKTALEDHIARVVGKEIHRSAPRSMGTGKSGMVAIDRPGQEILKRTAVAVTAENVTVCLSVGLPARGRKVLGRQAEKLFFEHLPDIIRDSVLSLEKRKIADVMQLCDQQQEIRRYMAEHGLVAFIADGSVLPRASGISDRPLTGGEAVPFIAPEEMAVEIPVPHRNEPVRGMGIKTGITLIVGGGYHGKSTLLQAVERGVYDHVGGDGREWVLTDPTAFKIRAEDGRQVTRVDISPFIQNLPYGKDTRHFSSENASGSTSQAANIIEALEAGANTLLIDEDTSATNFMIRDSRMQALVAKHKEPITPFIDKVKQLHDDYGVSTILVMGGSGDYFDVADAVVMMEQYRPFDVTSEAKQIADSKTVARKKEGGEHFGAITKRVPLPGSLNSKKGKKEKVAARGLAHIQYGTTDIELDQVEQLVDTSQTRAIGEILHHIEKRGLLNKHQPLADILHIVQRQIEENGLASFTPFPNQHPGDLACPRILEMAAALNRLRTLKVES